MAGPDLQPEHTLTSVLLALPEPAALVDRDGRLVTANAGWKDACGTRTCAEGELPGALGPVLAGLVVSGDDREALAEGLAAVLAGRAARFERRVRWAGEGPRRVARIEFLGIGADGALVRRFDHEEVAESLERWRGSWAGSLAGVGLWDYDVLTGDLWWSDEVYRIHEVDVRRPMTAERAIGFYTEDGRTVLERTVERAMLDGSTWRERLPIVTAKGNHIWVDARGRVDLVDGAPQRIYGTFRDVTDEVLAALKLQASEERLELVVKGSSDGYWDWNLEDDTFWYSPRYLDQLGYRPDEVEATLEFFEQVLHRRDAARVWSAIERHLEHREPFDIEFRQRHRDGSWRWMWSRGLASRDERGDAIRMSGVHTDVTRLHEGKAALDEARRVAEEANRSKSEFLANMSHEIRTPMTAILGFTDVLGDPALTEDERRSHVETIRRNGELLLAILNDILDISKIEAGRLAVERIATSPLDAARDVCRLLQRRADDKGLPLILDVVGALPRSFPGDPVRLRQILHNVVGNAIKFTSAGEVRLTVVFDRAAREISFAVADSGLGLDAEQRGRLFRPFSQADSSTTRRFGGTGLGLAISKRLAEALGGDIAVESTPGAGSTFTLTIPVPARDARDLVELGDDPRQEATPPALPTGKGQPLGGLRVLLAEDGVDNQRLISLYLRRAGALVTTVENGRLAVDRALDAQSVEAPFDLILMDMQMPELDGYGATQALREAGCSMPIVALTAHAMTGDRERCLAAGCSEYQTKPIDAAALIGCCAELTRGAST